MNVCVSVYECESECMYEFMRVWVRVCVSMNMRVWVCVCV